MVSMVRHTFCWGRIPVTEAAQVEYTVAYHRH
jgi:hypothetical protein